MGNHIFKKNTSDDDFNSLQVNLPCDQALAGIEIDNKYGSRHHQNWERKNLKPSGFCASDQPSITCCKYQILFIRLQYLFMRKVFRTNNSKKENHHKLIQRKRESLLWRNGCGWRASQMVLLFFKWDQERLMSLCIVLGQNSGQVAMVTIRCSSG